MTFRTEIYTAPGGVVYVEPGKEVEVLCYTRSEHRVALSRLPDAKEDQKFRIQDVGDQWNSVLGIFEVAADEVIHLICTREDWARRRAIVIVGRYKHNCPLPPPGNGLIIKTTTKGNFEFSCEAQYKLQGRKRVYCLPHGEWQHPLPSCDPAPARPSNCSMSHVHRLQRRTTTDRPTASTLPVVAEDVDGIRAGINDCQIKVDHLDKLLNESETRNLRMMEQIRVLQEEIRRLERN